MDEILEVLLESMDENKVQVTDSTLKVIVDVLGDHEFTEISYYTEKDVLQFKDKLKLKNKLVMDLTGENRGITQWTQTYLGDIITGIDELIELKTNDILKHTIITNDFQTEFDGEEDSVVVVETVEWNTANNYDEEKDLYTSSKQLYIFINQGLINE